MARSYESMAAAVEPAESKRWPDHGRLEFKHIHSHTGVQVQGVVALNMHDRRLPVERIGELRLQPCVKVLRHWHASITEVSGHRCSTSVRDEPRHGGAWQKAE